MKILCTERFIIYIYIYLQLFVNGLYVIQEHEAIVLVLCFFFFLLFTPLQNTRFPSLEIYFDAYLIIELKFYFFIRLPVISSDNSKGQK
jgi:hypothetical protein